jgi:dTDP-4-amino-4,6-dideoxygalactose transaminase
MNKIGFNKPYFTGKETTYIKEAVEKGHISGDGFFTKKCHQIFESRYGFKKCLLTTSCTDALEMAAILIDIKPDDEVIIPSYTFVSTANAFVLRGAKIVFADSQAYHPNIDAHQIEKLITPKTKAIVVVHYAGIACDMDIIVEIAKKHNLFLIEDAAQAIESFYKGKPLGSFGHLSAFSFHETKNIISGEGGMLVVNDEQMIKRAEIIREKGTNRSAFFRGEIDKYGWVDVGSSFLPSEIIAAFLYAQLENIEDIQQRRHQIWQKYYQDLSEGEKKGYFLLPKIFDYAQHNAHMFYIVCRNIEERTNLIKYLKNRNIQAVFHYLSLHKSPFYKSQVSHIPLLPHSDYFTDTLLRLPFYYELTLEEQSYISQTILDFYENQQ